MAAALYKKSEYTDQRLCCYTGTSLRSGGGEGGEGGDSWTDAAGDTARHLGLSSNLWWSRVLAFRKHISGTAPVSAPTAMILVTNVSHNNTFSPQHTHTPPIRARWFVVYQSKQVKAAFEPASLPGYIGPATGPLISGKLCQAQTVCPL